MPSGNSSTQSALQRLAMFVFTLAVVSMVVLPLGTCGFAKTLESSAEDYPEIFDDLGPHLERYYWDERRFQPVRQLQRALAALENAAEEIYVEYTGPDDRKARVHVGDYSHVLSLDQADDLRSAFAILKRTFDFLERHYRGDTPLNDVRIQAVNGFLTGLDPHTMVFSRKAFEEFYVHIEGEIFGVGMLVGVRGDGQLTVIEVLPNTPAKRAGFRNGDSIVKINEESTVNMTVTEAVKRIRGKRGTEVVLSVKRKEGDRYTTKRIPVTRDRVIIKSVESKLLPGGVGYVKVTSFDKNTVDSLNLHLSKLRSENGEKELSGLILDLRGNSGGLLKQASDMADLFLERGDIYSIADRDGVESFASSDDGVEPDFPMIALCNDGSASGAEIVIGALQQNDRALVLGAATFGKGSVQQLHPLPTRFFSTSYKAQLKITVSEYLIPGKISIQENGVVPDIAATRVLFNEGEIDYFENERRGTEANYEHHIVSKYAKDLKPRDSLAYPYVYEPPDEDAVGDEFMSGDIKPLEDNLVQIALELIKLEPGPGRSGTGTIREFVERNRDEIARIRREQMEGITKLLGEHGIDWSDGENPSSPPAVGLELSHRFLERPSKDEDEPYPEKVLVVSASVTNRSDRALYRLAGATTSDQGHYHEREFLFGKVAPGETVERSFEVVFRPSSASRVDTISVELRCPGTEGPVAAAEHEIAIAAEPFPEFSYSLTLHDDESGAEIDHLEPGTKARLVARIRNIGKAPVRKGVAVLRNESGQDVFLDVGRLDVRDLKPDEVREVAFKFHIREDSELDEFKFEYGVFGSHYPTGISRTFAIPGRGGGDAAKFRNGEEFRASKISLAVSYDKDGTAQEAGERAIVTDRDSVRISAQIEDEAAPFHAWVAITQLGIDEDGLPDKVSYAATRGGGTNLDLATDVPLKVGQNVISVVTTNDRGLSRRRVLFVRRTAGLE